MDSKYLSKIIRFHRKKAGLTQKELADLAGIGKTAVFDLEKGKPTAKMQTLLQVLSVLNIHLEAHSPVMDDFNNSQP